MAKSSKHTYVGTDVLINLPNLQRQDELDSFEAAVAGNSIAYLQLNPLKGKFDLNHLKAIHKEIFKDIYPFAGKVRDEDIGKDFFMFCPCENIEPYASTLFLNLKKENFLLGLDVEEFSIRAGEYLAEINILHPFREGNGRTQREFIRLLALNAGYEVDWSQLSDGEMIEASKRSVVKSAPLAAVIRKTILNAPKLILNN